MRPIALMLTAAVLLSREAGAITLDVNSTGP